MSNFDPLKQNRCPIGRNKNAHTKDITNCWPNFDFQVKMKLYNVLNVNMKNFEINKNFKGKLGSSQWEKS